MSVTVIDHSTWPAGYLEGRWLHVWMMAMKMILYPGTTELN